MPLSRIEKVKVRMEYGFLGEEVFEKKTVFKQNLDHNYKYTWYVVDAN